MKENLEKEAYRFKTFIERAVKVEFLGQLMHQYLD